MLAGEVNRREKQIHALSLQLVPLRQKIAGLDTTMALFDETVRPDAGGVVRAQTETYKAHGGLTCCVEDELKSAGPKGIDTVTLSIRVAIRCHVDLPTKKDLSKYRKDTIGGVVRSLREKGLVEPLFQSRGGHIPSIWCWKTLPSLADLALQTSHADGSL